MSLFNVLGQAGQVSRGFGEAEATARQAQLDALRVREAERLSQMYERAAQEAPRMYAPITTQPVGGGLAIPEDYMTRYAPVAVAPTAAAPATAAGVDAQLKAPVVEAPKQAPSETFSRELTPNEAFRYSVLGALPPGVAVTTVAATAQTEKPKAAQQPTAKAKPSPYTGADYPAAQVGTQEAARAMAHGGATAPSQTIPNVPYAGLPKPSPFGTYTTPTPEADQFANQPPMVLGADRRRKSAETLFPGYVPEAPGLVPPEAPPPPKAGKAPAAPTAPAAPATGKEAVKQQQQISQAYLANPQSITPDIQNAMSAREQLAQRRNDFARLAFIYQTSGTAEGLRQAQSIASQLYDIDSKIMEADNNMYYLQGMQGIQEVQGANDPRRLAAVMSHYTGVPVAYQPRTDGTYNVWVNNKLQREGVSAEDIISEARSNFDESYVKAMQKRAEDVFAQQLKNEGKMLDVNLEMQTFIAKQPFEIGAKKAEIIAQMQKDGALKMLDATLKGEDIEIKPFGEGQFTVQKGKQVFLYTPGKTVTMPNGMVVEQSPLQLLNLQ